MNHLFTRPPKKDSAHMAGQGARHGTVLKGPVSVVIPCYRSAAYLEETVDELFDVFFMHPDLRMHLFLIHPFLYDVFMDLNEGVLLPLRRRISGK